MSGLQAQGGSSRLPAHNLSAVTVVPRFMAYQCLSKQSTASSPADTHYKLIAPPAHYSVHAGKHENTNTEIANYGSADQYARMLCHRLRETEGENKMKEGERGAAGH